MSDSVQPHRWQSTRLPRPWDSPGKNTGMGCHFFLQCMKVKSESEVTQSCPTLSDPMDYTAHQAPPSMGFSRQEYWSGVPLPSPNTEAMKPIKFTNILVWVCREKKLICRYRVPKKKFQTKLEFALRFRSKEKCNILK